MPGPVPLPPVVPANDRPPGLLPTNAMRQPSTGAARLQRTLLLGGLFVTAAAATGVAPYLTFWTLAAVALAVRTISWTSESARERQHLRGRRRWYDGLLTALTLPWYLVVATGGTVVLLTWGIILAGVAGLSWWLFGLPRLAGLVVIGAVLAAGLWTGPGSRRLRLPTRRLVTKSTRDVWIGWTFVCALGIVLGAVLWALAGGDTTWAPQPGPPWRDGTLLGTLTDWL